MAGSRHVSSYDGRATWRRCCPSRPTRLWRIYSMTKPIISVAAMMLYEEGAFELTDPVSAFIPSFADVRVYAGGSDTRPVTVPAVEPVRVWHMLTHTSGLTYGFHRVHPVDARYRDAGSSGARRAAWTWRSAATAWAAQPLLFLARRGVELLGCHRRARPRGRGSLRSGPGRVPGPPDILGPLGMTRHVVSGLARRKRPGWPRSTRRSPPRSARRPGSTRWQGRTGPPADAQRRRRPDLHGGRLSPVHPDAAGPAGKPGAVSSTASACSARGPWPT